MRKLILKKPMVVQFRHKLAIGHLQGAPPG